MNVKYETPSLDTKFEVPYDYYFLNVDSLKKVGNLEVKLLSIQESMYDVADQAAAFLREYKLPDGVEGSALFTFMGYNAKVHGLLFGFKNVGVVGFPNISIGTDLGESYLSSHPEYNPDMYPNGHIQIEIRGGGLADKVAQEMRLKCESVFNKGKDSSVYQRSTKVEEFKDCKPLGLISKSKSISIPLNL